MVTYATPSYITISRLMQGHTMRNKQRHFMPVKILRKWCGRCSIAIRHVPKALAVINIRQNLSSKFAFDFTSRSNRRLNARVLGAAVFVFIASFLLHNCGWCHSFISMCQLHGVCVGMYICWYAWHLRFIIFSLVTQYELLINSM